MPSDYRRIGSGLWVPSNIRPRPKAIDLFCGAGGASLGFIQAGWEVVAGADNDPFCALTYMMNLGTYPIRIHYVEEGDKERLNAAVEKTVIRKTGGLYAMEVAGSYRRVEPGVSHFFFGDIRKLKGQDILDALGMQVGELDCVLGGPPCQGFSTMGKRQVMDPRNSLVFEFARLVLELQPKTIMFENVPGILTMVTPEGVPVLDAFCRVLEDGGFGTYDALKRSLLASSGCGAALRGKPKNRPEPDGEWDQGEQQLALFEEGESA